MRSNAPTQIHAAMLTACFKATSARDVAQPPSAVRTPTGRGPTLSIIPGSVFRRVLKRALREAAIEGACQAAPNLSVRFTHDGTPSAVKERFRQGGTYHEISGSKRGLGVRMRPREARLANLSSKGRRR
jgi:hypothetical protein